MKVRWKVDECASYFDRMRLRGWCFAESDAVIGIEVLFPATEFAIPLGNHGLPSRDVAEAIHPDAHHCRFDQWVSLPEEQKGRDFTLRFHLRSGMSQESGSVHENARLGDAGHGCWRHFIDSLHSFNAGDILEIGARARSAITHREHLAMKLGYVGLDIMPGTNVDIVGDAHQLAAIFGERKFVAVFSLSVFEHLAMPWKVVVEMNRVLVPGGLVFINTPQTWPLHDEPWDFWRFSIHAWQCLFNAATGFEIVEVGQGEPARIHPMWDAPVLRDMALHPAYLGSNVIARKIGETSLDWPVPTGMAALGSYPPGELRNSPA